MAILDQSMNLTGEEVDAGEQTEGAVALVLVVTREAWIKAGFGRQIWRGGGDRLDTGLLVIGDDHRRFALPLGRGLLLGGQLRGRRTAPAPSSLRTRYHAVRGSSGPCAPSRLAG